MARLFVWKSEVSWVATTVAADAIEGAVSHLNRGFVA